MYETKTISYLYNIYDKHHNLIVKRFKKFRLSNSILKKLYNLIPKVKITTLLNADTKIKNNILRLMYLLKLHIKCIVKN